MLGCVSELQATMGAVSNLSPAWIMAAAKHFSLRLDTLCHLFLLQPQLATVVFQQGSKRESLEMVGMAFFPPSFYASASYDICAGLVCVLSRVTFPLPV